MNQSTLWKKSFLLCCSPALVFVQSSAGHASGLSFTIPTTWLESHLNPSLLLKDDGFEKGTDFILKSEYEGLKSYKEAESKWYLHTVLFDLGIGLGGNVGVLLLRGTPAFQIYWKKLRPPVAPKLYEPESVETDSGYNINNDSDESIDRQIAMLTKAIYATGDVRYNADLEKNLQTTAKNYFAILNSVSMETPTEWGLSMLRMDMSINGSGMISPGQTVGGAVRVRLNWKPTPPKPAMTYSSLTEEQNKVANGFRIAVQRLALELDAWSQMNPLKGFHATGFRVGLGVSSAFNVGVVRAGAQAMVHANFTQRPKPVSALSANLNLSTEAQGVAFHEFNDNGPMMQVLGLGSNTYLAQPLALEIKPITVSRAQIQKGLNRAARMGRFFLHRSQIVLDKSKWEVSKIKTNLDISLSGNIRLVNVAGLVSLEVSFEPKK